MRLITIIVMLLASIAASNLGDGLAYLALALYMFIQFSSKRYNKKL